MQAKILETTVYSEVILTLGPVPAQRFQPRILPCHAGFSLGSGDELQRLLTQT
jgi:hypothetical protein